jgi:hypothetical protein
MRTGYLPVRASNSKILRSSISVPSPRFAHRAQQSCTILFDLVASYTFFHPYFFKSILPVRSNCTPSSFNRADCSWLPPVGRRLISPRALTTRCHGTCSGQLCIAHPTVRAAPGAPRARATWPYVITRPRGTRRTSAWTRAKKFSEWAGLEGRRGLLFFIFYSLVETWSVCLTATGNSSDGKTSKSQPLRSPR